MPNIAINGLGRVGKLLLRALVDAGFGRDVVLLNDLRGDPAQHALLLEFDTIHGRWPRQIGHNDRSLCIEGNKVRLSHAARIEDLALDGIDLVIDCTGCFTTVEATRPYFDAGVRKVLVSAPVREEGALNLVRGVNHHAYDPARHHLVTAASSTTNCLAPIVKVLHEGIGIRHGSITALHGVTNGQSLVDRPAGDMRRARSAMNALVPLPTDAAGQISAIFPELEGRLDGHAVRGPLFNASLTDAVFEMQRDVTAEAINELFRAAAAGPLDGILGVEERPLVSADFLNDTRSAIVDAPSTLVVNGTQAKVYAWYDNEWGYVCRMVDLARLLLSDL